MPRQKGNVVLVLGTVMGLCIPVAWADINNGTFDTDLTGWHTFNSVPSADPYPVGSAWIKDLPIGQSAGDLSYLSQEFFIDPVYSMLRFDFLVPRMSDETQEIFSVSLLESPKTKGNPFDSSDQYIFYGITTGIVPIEIIGQDVGVDTINEWRRVSVPVSSSWEWITLRFELTHGNVDDKAFALVDNVSLTVVPEPASMLLGTLGLGVAGVFLIRTGPGILT